MEQVMADRIIGMRTALRESLEKLGSPLSWEHVTKQVKTTIPFLIIYELLAFLIHTIT